MIDTNSLNEAAAVIGTTDKNAVFSALIAAGVELGLTMQEAYDLVLGENAYSNLADMIHNACNK